MKSKDFLTGSPLCALLLDLLPANTLRGADNPGAVDLSFIPGLDPEATINTLAAQPKGPQFKIE